MTDKELRKLKKSELLELLLKQNEEVEQLKSQLNKDSEEDSKNDELLQESEALSRQLNRELERKNYRKRYMRKLRSTISILIVVAAIAILIATVFLPVLQIYGRSMTPTVSAGDMVVSLKESKCKKGDIIAFYYNNKILVKRVIATSGQWVDINEAGDVTIDGKKLDEPYVKQKALGHCDIKLPYQVPEGKVFVMGDHRSVSVDSRKSSVGCVGKDQIVGKLGFRVWPLKKLGPVH